MFSKLLLQEVQDYINKNISTPAAILALQKNPFPDIYFPDVLNQISAKEKSKEKLPAWFNAENIIYPQKISIEQSSSEISAQYKAELVSGESLIDLTGGFGVDDFYFSKKVKHVTHCEINQQLSEIVTHNFSVLNIKNVECLSGDSTSILKSIDKKWDWIYIDPSRRNESKGKVFMLKDCLPNVPELLDFYFEHTDNILIKTAPLLDIKAGLTELHSVSEIHCVSVNNEMKELLWVLKKGFGGNPEIIAASLSKDKALLYTTSLNTTAPATYSLPEKYLYEPAMALLKTGAFNAISNDFKINKLHQHSQLYTSDNLIADFPGRTFIIESIHVYKKKDVKSLLENKKMNITVRNFPVSVDEIRKIWKIKEGGNEYAFFTTNMNNEKIMLLCSKI